MGSSHNRLVVVVNDDVTERVVLGGLLGREGLEVKEFASAVEALQGLALLSRSPSLIVTDLHMPAIDGWRFCRLLRSPEYAAFNEVPILIVSATFAGEDTVEVCLASGANAFLSAPVEGPAFLSQVRALIKGEVESVRVRCLLVEDNTAMANTLGDCLEGHGYDVQVAYDGATAQRLFAQCDPALLIVDYHLPDIEGDQLLESFVERRPAPIVIMMTGDPNPDLAVQWMRQGAAAYVQKPLSPEYLATLCASALRERNLLRTAEFLEERTREVRESRERYKFLAENLADIVWTTDSSLRITYVSPSVERILGFTPDEWRNQSIDEMVTPESMQRIHARFLNYLQYTSEAPHSSDPSPVVEVEYYGRDGSTVLMEDTMKAVRDASGVLAGIYGVSQDISERKRVENALAEEAVRRRILVEQSRDGIVVLDQNGKVFEANQRYADMLGYTADEVRHLHVWDWDLQWTREELMEMVRSVDAAGDHFETRHRRKDGSYYDVEVSTNGVALGGQKRIFCVCRDITARKRAEEALRASEEKYRGIFEESVVVTYVFDNQKNFVDANQAGLDLLGYSREELLQMRMPDVDADTRAVLPAHQKLLAGERLVNYEHKLRRKDGAVISVLNNSRPLTDSQGNVVGMLSTLVDITDRRRSEELTRARLERVRRESAVLAEIAASPFVAEGRIREAAALLTQTVSNAFGIARVGVWLFNDDKTRLVNIDNFDAEVNAHTKGAVLHEHEFREEFAVLKSAKYVDASEALTDPRVSGYVESYIKPMRITSMLDAVIRARGESLGTLCFEHVDTPHRWEDDEIAFACQLADQVALAASNRMRNRHERMTNARLRLTELAADHSVEELLQGFLDEAELLTDSHIGFFHFVDEDQATVQLQMWSTNTMKTMCTAEGKGAHYPLDEAGVWADCVREKVPLIHNDYLRLPRRKGLPEGHAPIVRELVVPVYREQKIVAILGVGNKDDDYVQEDVDVTVELAEMAWEIISRKRAEGDRERLTLAIEQAAEAIVITDKNGAIQYVNPSFTRTTGYTRREAIGQNPRILRSGTHDAAFYGRMWETLARGETWNGRIVNKAKDGTLFTEEAAISPVRDASGDIVSYVAVKRDISREIELEAQLRQSQKMEAVGQLAGGVAHDFNNLLQAILGYSELATDALEEKHPAREALSEVVAAGQRAATLVAQLLAFGRRQTMQPQDLDLNEVVAGMLKMLGRVIGEHIRMSFVQGHGLWTVHADRGMIEQTLMNLVVNGRDAMPKGGVLTLSTDNRLIDEIYCERYPGVVPGRYVLLSVTDSGCGMSEQIREKAFEPFFTTKGPGKGSGLGLATVYGVVKQHHGAVELHSEIDKGTTFNVFLPAVERRAAHADSNVHIQVAGGTETILLAEDEATVRVLGKRVLEDAGYSVLTAKNGREAVAQFKQFGPGIDLLILDVIMPEMGGPEAYSSIRALRPDVPVLFVSGYPNDSTHFSVELSDENWVLPKPYSAQQLLEQVRQLLDLRKKINADPPSA